VAAGIGFGLFRSNNSLVNFLLGQGVVAGQLCNLLVSDQIDAAIANVGDMEGIAVDDRGCHCATRLSYVGALDVLVKRRVGSLHCRPKIGSHVRSDHVVVSLYNHASSPMAGLATTLSSPHTVRNDQQLASLSQEFWARLVEELLRSRMREDSIFVALALSTRICPTPYTQRHRRGV
jgi:hypothetical protein